jgi:hypothetical protein
MVKKIMDLHALVWLVTMVIIVVTYITADSENPVFNGGYYFMKTVTILNIYTFYVCVIFMLRKAFICLKEILST